MLVSTDEAILNFIRVLATINSLFRQVHVDLEKTGKFCRITSHISPLMAEQKSLDEGTSLAFFFDCEIKQVRHREKQSIGVSLILRRKNQNWLAEGEIGWSGVEIGWDNFYDCELLSSSLDEFLRDLPQFTDQLLDTFRNELSRNASFIV